MSHKIESSTAANFSTNVAMRLAEHARVRGNDIAIASPVGVYRPGTQRDYRTVSFGELDSRSSRLAAGFQSLGIKQGKRIALLVRFGEDFITLVFGLLKTGATLILIDPGMGSRNLVKCLAAAEPDGFVAIPQAQAILKLLWVRFPKSRLNVTVGNRFGILPKPTLAQLEVSCSAKDWRPPKTTNDDEAAIIYTTGSTGPPKGVLYTHGTFNHQIDQLVERYNIAPGGKDLSGFPLFGLFNAVMGTTTIIPDMNPTRPADVDPPRLLDAIDQWQIDQAFGSPALWTAVGKYCNQSKRQCKSLRRVLSAGAPVPAWVLQWMRDAMVDEGMMFTPYGATEALPVASIESREVLEETAVLSRQGLGTCVGTRFSGIQWRVIAIDDGPLPNIDQTRELPRHEIGELLVCGPVVTHQYVTRTDQNALHKVQDGDGVWHRLGDVGYLDEQDRFWFCGRKSHRVQTSAGDLYTEPCESILNTHASVYRSALVGIGKAGSQRPVIIVEPWQEKRPKSSNEKLNLIQQLKELAVLHTVTATIRDILIYPKRLPTDVRHNAKIFRERLVPWARRMLSSPQDKA